MLAVVTLHPGMQGRNYRLPNENDYKAVWKAPKQLKAILDEWEKNPSPQPSPMGRGSDSESRSPSPKGKRNDRGNESPSPAGRGWREGPGEGSRPKDRAWFEEMMA